MFDDTAFMLVADHGMEETDPACTGDWDVALRAAGLDVPRRGLRLPLPRSLMRKHLRNRPRPRRRDRAGSRACGGDDDDQSAGSSSTDESQVDERERTTDTDASDDATSPSS